ncbi:hypothetical protein Thermus77838_15140 [Thermus oshimai]
MKPYTKGMRRLFALLLLFGLASAQSALSLRFGYGEALGLTFGAGVENRLRENLSGRLLLELAPAAPGLFASGELLFKPDLGRYDPTLRGLLPYLGGGLGGVLAFQGPSTLGVGFTGGLEALLDPTTGFFLEGSYVYGFGDWPKTWRLAFGANFR